MLDPDKTPFLFSVATVLSYRIAKDYYRNVQYVWCAPHFNSPDQPPTSNPLTIARRYIEQISSGDRHANEIDNNKAGILRGAKAKLELGIISKKERKEIGTKVKVSKYEDFYPVIFIINTKKVYTRIEEVPEGDKASLSSVEYKITDLKPDEFEIINVKEMLGYRIKIPDRKAGV